MKRREGLQRGRLLLSPAVRRRWLAIAAPLLLAVLALLFFWKLAFSGMILARGDTLLYFYPYWQVAREALLAAHVPLWNSQIFMGAPFIANSQAGFFYPLNWPFWLALPTPYAVSAAIVLHIMIAAAGCYWLARRRLGVSRAGAFLAAGAFALGGYLTAQVEHVNQLQGLSWLPWLLLAASGKGRDGGHLRTVLWGGFILAMQILAGHTQTVFISVLALTIFRVAGWFGEYLQGRARRRNGRDHVRRSLLAAALVLGGVSLVGILLAAVQLLPTLELSQLSGRRGGLPLNEAVSFSLHPLLVSQSLLPPIAGGLFTEYVAFLPVTALLVAAIAAGQWRRVPEALSPLALTVGGLFLALGRFNPVYLLLAQLPGFSLFRAPARWMALYALGIALLAGIGLDLLRGVRHGNAGPIRERALWWAGAGAAVLMLWGLASGALRRFVPVGAETGSTAVSPLQMVVWLLELALAVWLLGRLRAASEQRRQMLVGATLVLVFAVLFWASRTLPYNHPTTAEAYLGLRAPVARLQAMQRCDLLAEACDPFSDRLLSLSDIFFDPGDMTELASIHGETLSEDAFFDYIVAVKQKEIIAPNLPMAYGLSSVDGFDGGVLPLRSYSMLMRLIFPEETTDGRLREYLDAIPEGRWLDLFGARYVLTDKVGDEWRRGVFFDRQHSREVAAGETVEVGYLPDYEASEVWLLGELEGVVASVAPEGGDSGALEVFEVEDGLWRVVLPQPAVVEALQFSARENAWRLHGLALVDERDGSFHSIVPGQYRLIYSGDVKIYENLNVLPRAFVVNAWRWRADDESTLSAMSAEPFNPAQEAIVRGQGNDVDGSEEPGVVQIKTYRPEEIVVEVKNGAPGLLVVTEANYPGWRATIDGQAANVEQVDGLFRGVMTPAGEHEVRLYFRSQSYELGLLVTVAAIVAWGGLQILLWRRRVREPA